MSSCVLSLTVIGSGVVTSFACARIGDLTGSLAALGVTFAFGVYAFEKLGEWLGGGHELLNLPTNRYVGSSPTGHEQIIPSGKNATEQPASLNRAHALGWSIPDGVLDGLQTVRGLRRDAPVNDNDGVTGFFVDARVIRVAARDEPENDVGAAE